MKTPKGFFVYFHHAPILHALTKEQVGELFTALMDYGYAGELPDFSGDGALQVAFALFRTEIDYNFERYNEICEKRSEAGKKGGRPKKEPEESPENSKAADPDDFIQSLIRLKEQKGEKDPMTKI